MPSPTGSTSSPSRRRQLTAIAGAILTLMTVVSSCVPDPAVPGDPTTSTTTSPTTTTTTTQPVGPVGPLALTVGVGAGAVEASWGSTSGSQPTRVELASRTGNGSWTQVIRNGLTGSLTGLVNGTTYQFRVRAIDNAGVALGAWSPERTLRYFTTTLPVLSIDTGGAPIVSKEDYLPGSYRLLPNGAPVSAQAGGTRIRGRGNSTWSFDKKPYRLKLDAATPLMGMPSDKNWVLLANSSDRSHLRTQIATAFGEASNQLAWTPKFRYVELVLNGRYDGLYLLGEQIQISSNRVNIDKMQPTDNSGVELTGGYRLELDWRYDSAQELGFWADEPNRYPFVLHDPDPATPQQLSYIKNYINQLQTAVFGPNSWDPNTGFRKYIDTGSFIDWFLVNEVTNNQDAFLYSTHMYKPRNGKLHFGPIWDFDLSMGTIGTFSVPTDPNAWWSRYRVWSGSMLADPAFASEARARWAQLRPAYTAIVNNIGNLSTTTTAARSADSLRWGYTVTTPDTPAFLQTWLRTKMNFLDANL